MAKPKVPVTVAEWAGENRDTGKGAGGKFTAKRESFKEADKASVKRLAKALQHRFVDRLTLEETGKLTGMSVGQIKSLTAPFKVLMEHADEIALHRHHEGDVLDAIKMFLSMGMLEQLQDPERRQKMDFSRLSWGYGTLFDKLRLHRGESTSNVMTLSDLVKQAHARPIPGKEQAEDAEIVDVPAVVTDA